MSVQDPTVFHGPVEIKTEKWDPFMEEVVAYDDTPEEFAEVKILPDYNNSEENSKTNAVLSRYHLLKTAGLSRGLLPEEHENSYQSVLNLPVVKRCCIEHCYFYRSRPGACRYNLRTLPTGSNTLQFENANSTEQQTIDLECLASDEVKSVNDYVYKYNVNGRKRNSLSSSSSCSDSSSSGSSFSEDCAADDSNDEDYCPEDNSSGTDCETTGVRSVKSDSVREIWKSRTVSGLKNDFGDRKKCVPRRWLGRTSYPATNKIPSNFVSVHDLLAQFKNMQKLVKSKCENTFEGESGKTAKLPPPRLKKMISRGKNWRMEYMDNKVQRLGLDDLLLKASELNAENFTKALGRKLDTPKTNYNTKENPEIFFTIPKTKKNSVEKEGNSEADSDAAKRQNLKTIKIDISKPFFESDKGKESESVPLPPKPQEEDSPKRPGIKVKTVENINEEFKDSLGLKTFQDSHLSVVDAKNIGGRINYNGSIKDGEVREKNGREEPEKIVEGSQPFIMTIIQSKAEKQRPAILRNSSCFKKKTNIEKTKPREKLAEAKEGESPKQCSGESEKPAEREGTDSVPKLPQDKSSFNENFPRAPVSGRSFGSFSKILNEPENELPKSDEAVGENRFTVKKRNIPFILNHNRKARQAESSSGGGFIKPESKLVKINESEKLPCEKTLRVTSIEQKLGPKEVNRRFIKVVPYEQANKPGKKMEPVKGGESQPKLSDEEAESPQKDERTGHLLSLSAFATILKEILPDKWILCLDKKYGLQIIKTQVDEHLNPSILMSVVVGRCGKLTVNVRGKQLHKTHELFSNLCDVTNSDNKLSLNYVLGIINKLRCLSVCFGCDDPSLKKYWCEDGIVEHHSEFQQVYRSHLCQLLVSMGKKRCYPCYRMNESLKKRYRREKMEEKPREDGGKDSNDTKETDPDKSAKDLQSRGVKRNLEDFLEESFSTMKQQIVDEIEKNKKLGERENALKAQDEILSFMGLTRKESLDVPLRKSKRKKNSFYKLQQPVKKKIDQQELEFLEKYWGDINTLFSTSLLFGAYSRTGRGRLREKCRMFQKLLSTWRNIVRSNPEWIGKEIKLPDELTDGDNSTGKEDQFEKMDVPALRAYIINSVKEVNRIKHKLRTKNSYFKLLYNKFVKRRMKRPKGMCPQKKGSGSSPNSTTNTPTPTDFSSDESSRDKEKTTDDENRTVTTVLSDRD